MRAKRLRLLKVAAAIAVIALGLWIVQNARERQKTAEREAHYHAVLAKYTSDLKVGMTREQVEQHLKTDGKRFRQMCCVANFRGVQVNLMDSGWDDLVKIGEESAPWFCGENNVYIAFEFNPKSPGELSKTNASDILKRAAVFHQLEDCM